MTFAEAMAQYAGTQGLRLEAPRLLDLTSTPRHPMAELMGDIRAESKPGTALRIMVEEHRHMDEFMAMVKAKMDLDEKYLGELKTLRDSWNPQWKASGVWPLISPFLTHINNEIDEREKIGTELSSRLAALPDTPPLNAPHEDGFDLFEMVENAETRYYRYEKCHQIIGTPESISALELWQNQVSSMDMLAYLIDPVSMETGRLPQNEREYRRAVVAQQTAAECVAKWHANTLPDVLERHQQRAEVIKSFLSVLFTCYSSICSSLSISCSTALSSNRAFSSSEFIAPRHDETEKESSHALLQAVDYYNYILDGEVAQPIFGLGIKTVSLINELLDYNPELIPPNVCYMPVVPFAFELEKAATRSERSAVLESSKHQKAIFLYIVCAFLMEEPLLPLPENIITQYRDGISRARLSDVMATHLPLARQGIVTLVVRFADMIIAPNLTGPVESGWRAMGSLLCHNNGAAQIIASIWRKWDIVNDCPFPEGVERVWNRVIRKSEVVWKKTRSPYYTAMSNSPA